MLNFLKYLLYMLIFISLLLFYFFFTPLGQQNIYDYISEKLSKKADLEVKVKSIDITQYPQVHIILNIEKKAKLTLWGKLNDTFVDMDYTLTSDCIATEYCEIDDDIHIKGHVKGAFSKLSIRGKGTALDGNVTYSGIKYTNRAEHIKLIMRDINSSKLLKLMGEDAMIDGKANVDIDFDHMDETHKKGTILYHVKDHNFKGIPLDLSTKIDIKNEKHTFSIDVISPYLTLNITKGTYNQEEKKANALYLLDIKDLTKLKKLLGNTYKGDFYARGVLSYDKFLKITGLSKTFGGMTEFTFEKDGLKIHLDKVKLESIMSLFPMPPMLTAYATGDIYYNFIQETVVVNTALINARFVECNLAQVIRKKADVNMLKEVFDDANLDLIYHHDIIRGELTLANDHSHLYLKNTKIHTEKNTINAYFDFKMQRQEFSGKVYGSLDNPKVNLNMQKLVRYQMDKQVDKMIGKNNRKIMEKMPMGGVAKDVATDMGASFMKVFF